MHYYGIKQLLIKEENLNCCMNHLPMATREDGIIDLKYCCFD